VFLTVSVLLAFFYNNVTTTLTCGQNTGDSLSDSVTSTPTNTGDSLSDSVTSTPATDHAQSQSSRHLLILPTEIQKNEYLALRKNVDGSECRQLKEKILRWLLIGIEHF